MAPRSHANVYIQVQYYVPRFGKQEDVKPAHFIRGVQESIISHFGANNAETS